MKISDILKKRRGEVSMGPLVLVFLVIVIALAITPVIGDLTYGILWNSTNTTTRAPNNITGAARDIVELSPLIWVFLVLGIGAVVVVKMFEDIS